MAENNDSNDGYETILNLSYPRMSDEKFLPTFYLSRPKIHVLYKQSTTEEIYDDVRLKYFKLPKPTSYPIDLNQGFEQFIRRIVGQSFHLLKVLKFILEAEENIIHAHNFGEAQTLNLDDGGRPQLPPKRKLVLSHWGVLSRIMAVPYRMWGTHDTTFYAMRYCGILHLIDSNTYFDKEKHHSYHGKFEQACFSDDPDLEPVTDVPVDRNDSTFGIYRSNLKEYDLIYSADLSGVISEHKINDIHNMDEINQCKFIQTRLLVAKESVDNFLTHTKCLLWWAQFYLTNTSDVCIGLRDGDGVMRTPAHLLKSQDIPKNQKWLPEVCIRFLNTMLTLIEETMSKVNCPYTVYEFKFDSSAKCIKLKINNGKNDLSFLPENYIEHCKQQMNTK